jgi:hypothetical protein
LDRRYPPVRKSNDKEIIMTDDEYSAARFARTAWWHHGKLMPNLLIGVVALMAYLALPFVENLRPAQGASKPEVATGTTVDNTVNAALDQRLVEEIVAMGSIELLGADALQFAQNVSNPAVPGGSIVGYVGYAADATPERQPADENPIQTYTAWLRAAHARAALDGQDAPLPEQF